jgi:glycosyltransferase involved in cell wall biosynthesis
VLEGSALFPNREGPDVVHVWTPREIVRMFWERIRTRYKCRLVIHMEDNEWHILACGLCQSFEDLDALDTEDLDSRVPPSLSHPHRARAFLQEADGITVIIDRLVEIVPPHKYVMEMWPSADETLFYPRERNRQDRELLGIPVNSTVLAYTGNVHSANAHEVRSLYLAVAILNREGHPTTLVRAGRDFYPFLGADENWARRHSIELGMVPHKHVPDILALADVLVQPGSPDEFNDYRFPSKLPEFLAIGRPVVLPNTNIARHVAHGVDAFLLPKPNAVGIAAAVREIMLNEALQRQLSAGAVAFFMRHLSWTRSASRLHKFYLELAGPTRTAAAERHLVN